MAWSQTLNPNIIFAAIPNMVISQQVETRNVSHKKSLMDANKVDGTLYGDTKLYYFTDADETFEFLPDTSNQLNLLAVRRPKDPVIESITIDNFRWTEITTDSYLSKQAFSTESVFSQFRDCVKAWLSDDMNIHMNTTYNCFVGTDETTTGSQDVDVDLSGITAVSTTADEESYNRLVAEAVATALDNLGDEMADYSREYNDLQYLRTFDIKNDCYIVWNNAWKNLIRKTLLPSIFHKDGLLDMEGENSFTLNSRYFGTVNASAKVADGTATRSLIEQTITDTGVTPNVDYHYFAGDLIKSGLTAPAGSSYQEAPGFGTDDSVICKVIHKDAIPIMAGFETTLDFNNPKNRSTNTYLHFGYNTLKHIAGYPVITVKAQF